jgi:hypothetical protein
LGFTRAISICGKVAVVALVARIVPDSCACAASDHAIAAPPNRLMTHAFSLVGAGEQSCRNVEAERLRGFEKSSSLWTTKLL